MTSTSGLSASIARLAESTFGVPRVFERVRDLALQVRLVDDVGVDDPEMADPGGRQVERRRGAETAGSDQQDLGLEHLELAGLADLRDQEVPRVARAPLLVMVLKTVPTVLPNSGAKPFDTCWISATYDSEIGISRMPARSLSVLLLPSIW